MKDDPSLLADPIAWGRELIRVRDIDPVYDMLVGAITVYPQIRRWLLAYWCLYHVGAASMISEHEGGDFWDRLYLAADNTTLVDVDGQLVRWPRSAERRHWRGNAARQCVTWLRQAYKDPEDVVDSLIPRHLPTPINCNTIMEHVQVWPSFGPWIGFKVADMMERVYGADVRFPIDVAFYETPRAGLELVAGKDNTDYGYISYIQEMIRSYKDLSPPGLDTRLINVQEIETCLCKFKSARGGHYYIGKDTHEISKALVGWGSTANKLLQHVPSVKTFEPQAEPLTAR